MSAETFHARFLPVFLTIVLFGGLVAWGVIYLAEGGGVDIGGVAAAGAAVAVAGFIWARRLIAAYPVRVGPAGIRAYGLRAGPAVDAHWIEWRAITRANRIYFPFISCLILRVREHRRRFWIPSDLSGTDRFRKVVYAHAGRAHPIGRAVAG